MAQQVKTHQNHKKLINTFLHNLLEDYLKVSKKLQETGTWNLVQWYNAS
jgi:hypothetical protein